MRNFERDGVVVRSVSRAGAGDGRRYAAVGVSGARPGPRAFRGDKARVREIWERFPKFIIGYVLTFVVILVMALGATPEFVGKIKSAMGEANTFRGIFFVMTFFTIGVMSNFRKLWEEGIGKLAAVYLLCLFGFVIWVGLVISFIFFAGVKPPLVTG